MNKLSLKYYFQNVNQDHQVLSLFPLQIFQIKFAFLQPRFLFLRENHYQKLLFNLFGKCKHQNISIQQMYSRLFKPIENTLLLIGQSPFELSFLIFKARKTKGNLLLAYPSGMKCRDVQWTVLDWLV